MKEAADQDAAVCYLNWLNSPEALKALADVELKANDDTPPPGKVPANAVIAEAATTEEIETLNAAAKFYAKKLEQ